MDPGMLLKIYDISMEVIPGFHPSGLHPSGSHPAGFHPSGPHPSDLGGKMEKKRSFV